MNKWFTPILIGSGIIIVVWLILSVSMIVAGHGDALSDLGGAMQVMSAIFAGVSVVLVAITLSLQQAELKLTREEFKAQRREFEKMANAQEQTLQLAREQHAMVYDIIVTDTTDESFPEDTRFHVEMRLLEASPPASGFIGLVEDSVILSGASNLVARGGDRIGFTVSGVENKVLVDIVVLYKTQVETSRKITFVAVAYPKKVHVLAHRHFEITLDEYNETQELLKDMINDCPLQPIYKKVENAEPLKDDEGSGVE